MKRNLLIILCFFCISSFSAELKFYVSEKLMENPTDLTPRTASREDANKEPAAVLRVTSTVKNLVFESSYILDYKYNNGVYVIYIAGGAKKMEIRSANGEVLPLSIRFKEFGINALKPQMAYKMAIATQSKADNGFLSITTTPSAANVYIDDKFVGTSNLKQDVEVGNHTIRIEKEHFATIQKLVTIEKDVLTNIDSELEIKERLLEIQTDPQSDIYIDEQKVGKSTYKKHIDIGKHTIKVCYGDLSKQKKIDVTDKDVIVELYNLGTLELIFEKSNIEFEYGRDIAYAKNKSSVAQNRTIRSKKESGMYGTYSVRFNRDGKWARSKNVSIAPGEKAVLQAPNLYDAKPWTFLNLQYSPKADVGLMFGICGHYVGGYVSGRYNIGADFFHGNFGAPANSNVFGVNSWAVDGGLMLRACQELYFYVGAGYGRYESGGAKFPTCSEISGATAEAGVIINAHARNGQGFTFVVGYNTLLTKEYFNVMNPWANITAGIGFAL